MDFRGFSDLVFSIKNYHTTRKIHLFMTGIRNSYRSPCLCMYPPLTQKPIDVYVNASVLFKSRLLQQLSKDNLTKEDVGQWTIVNFYLIYLKYISGTTGSKWWSSKVCFLKFMLIRGLTQKYVRYLCTAGMYVLSIPSGKSFCSA